MSGVPSEISYSTHFRCMGAVPVEIPCPEILDGIRVLNFFVRSLKNEERYIGSG